MNYAGAYHRLMERARGRETESEDVGGVEGQEEVTGALRGYWCRKTWEEARTSSEIHRQRLTESLRKSEKHKAAVRAFSATAEYRAKQSVITTQAWARRRADHVLCSSDIITAGG